MKKFLSLTVIMFFLSVMLMQSAFAAIIDQYATNVIGYSSQYAWSYGWYAANALGAPDVPFYGDNGNAWAPLPANGTLEYLTLGYATPVYATGATIRETFGNGFVYQVDLVDTSDIYHTVWTGTDTSLPGSLVDFQVSWLQTAYEVKGIKIYVNTDHDMGAWEEIDAVRLTGATSAPVPVPAAVWLLGSGLVGIIGMRRRFKK
jgi:hypothetical protein